MPERRGQLRERQSAQTAWAFFRVGYVDAVSYPLTFLTNQLIPLSSVFLLYFLAKIIVEDDALVAGDYFTYAMLGNIVLRVLGAGLESLGMFMQRTIDQGQLELYLTQPVRWGVLPFAWFEWLLVERVISSLFVFAVAVMLGTHIDLARIVPALVVLALGTAATHALGILAASFRLLAKRADPVMTLYTIGTTILSGVMFPVKLLPDPLRWLSWLLPHTYTVDAVRQLVMPGAGRASAQFSITEAVLALVVYCAIAYPLAIFAFRRSIEFAREHGLVGSY